MKCPYCDTVFDIAAMQEKDEILNQQPADNITWENQSAQWDPRESENAFGVYTCKSCGGEIMADDNTAATQCPFCGNPVMLTSRLSGGLKPDYVLPFKLSKEDAKNKLRQFMSKKRLLPKMFSSENHLEEIKGVYVPFWLYDANVDASVSFHATRVRHWSDKDYDYTETSHFQVYRAGSVAFEHVPVDGSSQMPDDMMQSLEPFDFNEVKPFMTAYLSGYLADKYDEDAQQSVGKANARMKTTTENTFASTVQGYTSVVPEGSSVQIHNGQARYALYPVWLLHTKYQDKDYQFAMNGQTGKFIGAMPMDKGAYWKWKLIYSGIASVVVWGALWVLSYFFGG